MGLAFAITGLSAQFAFWGYTFGWWWRGRHERSKIQPPDHAKARAATLIKLGEAAEEADFSRQANFREILGCDHALLIIDAKGRVFEIGQSMVQIHRIARIWRGREAVEELMDRYGTVSFDSAVCNEAFP